MSGSGVLFVFTFVNFARNSSPVILILVRRFPLCRSPIVGISVRSSFENTLVKNVFISSAFSRSVFAVLSLFYLVSFLYLCSCLFQTGSLCSLQILGHDSSCIQPLS